MKCCPICNGSGTERSRESIIKNGKLVDRVIMECNHPSHGLGAFIRYDDPTIIDQEREKRLVWANTVAVSKEELHKAIKTSDGNVAQLARDLYISRTTLDKYLGWYPDLKLLVEERRMISKVKQMERKLEEDQTLRKRLEKRSSPAVTPLMDKLVMKLDRVAREQRKARMQDRIRSKIASFEN